MRFALIALLLAACTDEPRQPASASEPAAASAAAPSVSPSPSTSPAPSPFELASCGDFRSPCGLTIVGRFAPAGAVALPLSHAAPLRLHRSRELSGAALAGDQLFVTVDICPQCAAVHRFTSVADLKTISSQHLANLQQWMGRPATPLLRTGAAWRQAFGL